MVTTTGLEEEGDNTIIDGEYSCTFHTCNHYGAGVELVLIASSLKQGRRGERGGRMRRRGMARHDLGRGD